MTTDKDGGAAFPQEELEAVRRRHGSDHLHLRYDSREYRELYENAHTDRATLLAHVDRLSAELAKERERRVEVEGALAFYADATNYIGYPDPNAKVYIETSAIDRDGGNRARALIAGVKIEDRFVQIGWTNEAQIGYITADGEGSVYPNTDEDCHVPVYRAATLTKDTP